MEVAKDNSESGHVIRSHPDTDGFRCVDIIDFGGTFGFKEFRKDPEDMGRWTLTADFTSKVYESEAEAVGAARAVVAWFGLLAA